MEAAAEAENFPASQLKQYAFPDGALENFPNAQLSQLEAPEEAEK